MHRAQPITAKLFPWLCCLAAAVLAPGCGGGGAAATSSAEHGDSPPSLAIKPGSEAPRGANSETPGRYELASTNVQPLVRINTSLGPIDIRLDSQAARVTVQNFLNYVQSNHYAETVFHYVEQGQMILGGGFAADGSPKPVGMSIRNEAHNGRRNKRGTIAMARDAAVIDSATSQFFINLQDAPHLDHAGDTPDQYGYCVFGEVVQGFKVAEQIAAVPTQKQVVDGVELEVPTKMVRIQSVEILR